MAQHHVEVLVSREKFSNNIRHLRGLVAPSRICVVMKANAYRHGLEALAPVAVEAGADMIGICTNPEAETVRRLGLTIPLLRLRMALEAEMEESVRELDEVRLGDEVVLIGCQGDDEVTFEEMADKFSSVHTEINLMAGGFNKISYV